ADQADLFVEPPRTPGCIRLEIGRCLGPCAGACTATAYATTVRLARSFLDGATDTPMEKLRAEMAASARRVEVEGAASFRDKLERLQSLRDQFDRLRFAVESLSFLYHVPGVGGDDRVYLVRRGRVRGEVPAPRTTAERRSLSKLAAEIFHAGEL